MPTVSQILAASYNAVLTAKKKPTNQWAESAFLRALEAKKMIKRVSFGVQLEETLDYRANPDASFLATDLQTTSLTKTEVLTAALYDAGQLGVPITWSKADEAKNPSENQKVALVKSLIENALESHDDLIEEALFAVSTDGFLGLQTVVPSDGQGSLGGISAVTEAWWRNYESTYADDGSDIVAQLTTAFNSSMKGTGGAAPALIVSNATAQAFYEGAIQTNQRFIDAKEGDAGFKMLAFRNAGWTFSQYCGDVIYGLNPKYTSLKVSKDAFRQRGETQEIQNAHGYTSKLYSMLQLVTSNKSRNFVLDETAA